MGNVLTGFWIEIVVGDNFVGKLFFVMAIKTAVGVDVFGWLDGLLDLRKIKGPVIYEVRYISWNMINGFRCIAAGKASSEIDYSCRLGRRQIATF